MNKENINKNQRLRLFIIEFFGFVLVFTFIGFLIFFFYRSSVYENTDAGIRKQSADIQNFFEATNQNRQEISPDSPPLAIDVLPKLNGDRGIDVLFLGEENKIINSANLGDRALFFEKYHFKENNLKNEPITVKINNEYYRYLIVDVPEMVITSTGSVSKVAVLKNFTAETLNMKSFIKVLIASLLAGLAWALLISFWISQRMMLPILNSWKQQQDFVDSAAHELRTPLTIIQNKMENLLRQPNAKITDVSENIVQSLSEVRRLNQLTSDMLTLAKTGSNMTKLEPKSVDIKEKLTEILEPYREIAEVDDRKLKIKIDTQVKTHLNLDDKRLHQLIVILLDNSIKYTKQGDQIEFKAVANKNSLSFSVANSGPQISNAAKKKIFERFYREEQSGNRKTGGSGLGLSIAQWIVTSYHGKISVDDWKKTDPKGVIFKVNLPELKIK